MVILLHKDEILIVEYNTDEETDELLERQYNVSERNASQTAEANGPDTLGVQVLVLIQNDSSVFWVMSHWSCDDDF